tara:strand:+ start:355 stop:585 length:231 start_codon:yes stop_codon:yes gene_type:complete
MKSNNTNFKVGQEIKTIKYTDNKDIVKVRKIYDLKGNDVMFEGLSGWWMYKDTSNKPNTDSRKFFHKGDNQLIIIK